MKSNLTDVLTLLIKELRAQVSYEGIKEEIARHPENNSMLLIKDLLDNWRIPNAAYKLRFEELIGVRLSTPFVVHCKNKEFALIKKWDDKGVILSKGRYDEKSISVETFRDIYDNTVLFAEKAHDSGEHGYILKKKKAFLAAIRLPCVIVGIVVVTLIFLRAYTNYFSSLNWPIFLLTLFKTTGLATAILLLTQSFDTNNPLIQVLCGTDNNKNCNAILSSKAARVTNWLSWSEVGFFYFASSLLALLFNSNNTQLIQILAIINLITLPYTFYSIYHQWVIAKQWCLLCCTIQMLLWFECFAFLPYLLQDLSFTLNNTLVALFVCFVLPILFWIFIKPLLLKAQQIGQLKQQLQQIKYSNNLFDKLLNDEVKYALPSNENSIILSNSEAEHVVTLVSNPYCDPCAKAHKLFDEWLSTRSDIKFQVIFTVDENSDGPNTKVAEHLFALRASNDSINLKKAINDWYDQQRHDFESWSMAYPLDSERVSTHEAIRTQREWCNTIGIVATPTILINGRKLPSYYLPEDIKYLI